MYDLPIINVDELISEDQDAEACVVFHDYLHGKRAPAFVHWFTRPGYRHCFIMLPSATNGTVIANQGYNGMILQATAWDVSSCALACHRAGFTVRRVFNEKKRGYTQRGLITCVSVVKSILGIEDMTVITPYQLDRYLLRRRMVRGE